MIAWLWTNTYIPKEAEILPEWMNFWFVRVNGKNWPTICNGVGAESKIRDILKFSARHDLVVDEDSFTVLSEREFLMLDYGTRKTYCFKWYPQDQWYEGLV